MEIVPKPPKRVSIIEKVLFLFSLFLLFFAITSFVFLFFSVKTLNSRKEELNKKISELETPEIKAMKEEIFQIEKKALALENLLNSHSLPSNFFPFLENKILKNVILKSLDLNISEKKAKVSGIAENFSTLSRQYFLFAQPSEIENVEITSVSITPEGKIKFEISLSFKDDVIK